MNYADNIVSWKADNVYFTDNTVADKLTKFVSWQADNVYEVTNLLKFLNYFFVKLLDTGNTFSKLTTLYNGEL